VKLYIAFSREYHAAARGCARLSADQTALAVAGMAKS
jgi:uncharacterized membrane protein